MSTINTAPPAILHRPLSQAPAQSARTKEEESVAASQPGRSEAEPQAKGVLRLLQQSHFKGVADVRLRINFHEQLTALDSAAEQGSAIEAVGAFNTAISESLSAQETVPAQVAEALQNFQAELAELDKAVEDAAGLSEAVGAAYAGLTSALNELLTPAAESEPPLVADIPGAELPGAELPGTELSQEAAESESLAEATSTLVDVADVAQTDGGEFDASALMAALELAFASFQEALSSAQVSHELTPPSGNGVAFDRFLEIYQSLYSVENPADAEQTSGSIIDQAV